MKNHLKKIIFTGIALGALMGVGPKRKTNAAAEIGIINPKVVFNLSPGMQQTKSTYVLNTSKNKITYQSKLYDFTYREDGTLGNMLEQGGIPKLTAKDIISIKEEEFELNGGEKKQIDISANIPKDYDYQSRYALLHVSTVKTGDTQKGTSVHTNVAFGVQVILNVVENPGIENPNSDEMINSKIAMLKYEISEQDLKYEFDEVWKKNEKNLLKKLELKNLFKAPKLSGKTSLKNIGDIAFETATLPKNENYKSGSYHEYSFGSIDGAKGFNLKNYTVTPDSLRIWKTTLEKGPIFGTAKLKTRIYIEADYNYIEKTTTVFIIPWHIIIFLVVVILVLVIAIVFLLKLLKFVFRGFKKSGKKEKKPKKGNESSGDNEEKYSKNEAEKSSKN